MLKDRMASSFSSRHLLVVFVLCGAVDCKTRNDFGTHNHDHDSCGSCGASEPVAASAAVPLSGSVSVGEALSGRERVTIAALDSNPEQYHGKSVRLEGEVTAMCHHRRLWFAVKDEGDASGKYVRVLTGPRFLVPEGAMGRKVRTEGTIEILEVPEAEARHHAKDHKLGDPSAVQGPQKRIVLRATGAQFE